MYRSQQFPEPKKKAVVFDLDGTLADTMKWKKHHKHDHPKFAKEALKVGTIKKNVNKIREWHEQGDDVIILTARSAHYEDETKKWLDKNDIPYDQLLMRPADDSKTKDPVIKERILKADVLPKYDVVKAYDDKRKNVKMYREHDIPTKKV